jgi:hypothetical protein
MLFLRLAFGARWPPVLVNSSKGRPGNRPYAVELLIHAVELLIHAVELLIQVT